MFTQIPDEPDQIGMLNCNWDQLKMIGVKSILLISRLQATGSRDRPFEAGGIIFPHPVQLSKTLLASVIRLSTMNTSVSDFSRSSWRFASLAGRPAINRPMRVFANPDCPVHHPKKQQQRTQRCCFQSRTGEAPSASANSSGVASSLFGLSSSSSSTTYPAAVPSENVTTSPSSPSFFTARI